MKNTNNCLIFNENTANMSMVILLTVKKNTDKEMTVSVGNLQIIAAIITSCKVIHITIQVFAFFKHCHCVHCANIPLFNQQTW